MVPGTYTIQRMKRIKEVFQIASKKASLTAYTLHAHMYVIIRSKQNARKKQTMQCKAHDGRLDLPKDESKIFSQQHRPRNVHLPVEL
jgi:hypothetical protein